MRSIEVPESKNAGKSRVPRAGPGAFVLGGARGAAGRGPEVGFPFRGGALGSPGGSWGLSCRDVDSRDFGQSRYDDVVKHGYWVGLV